MSGRRVARAIVLILGGIGLRAGADDKLPTDWQLLVRDAATHDPVVGASVEVQSSSGNRPAELTTDAAGMVRYPLPPQPASLFAKVTADGHVPMILQFQFGQVPAKYELTLPAGVTVGGHVAGDDGVPIAGATVVLTARQTRGPDVASGDAVERQGVRQIEITTDDDGAWTFTGMPAAFVGADVGLLHPDFACQSKDGRGYYDFRHLDDRQSLLDKTATLVLDKGQPIAGTVTDAGGKPLPGARIALGSERLATNVVPEIIADEQGRFTLHVMPGEPVTITARLGGHAPVQTAFTMPDGPRDVALKMGPKRSLKGHVVDDAGKPVGGVDLLVSSWHGTRVLSKYMPVDPQGRFSWSNAPDDDVQVDARAEGYASQGGITMNWSRENVVTMRPAFQIEGTVVDDATGQPVTQFTAIPGMNRGGMDGITWRRAGGENGTLPLGVNDPAGHFVSRFGENLPNVAVRIEAAGYLPAESLVFKTTDHHVTVQFRLKRGTDVSATVTGTNGKPLANVEARLALPGDPVQVRDGRLSQYDRESPRATTDDAGRVTFPPQLGDYRIVLATPDGTAALTPADVAAGKPIALTPWAVVDGTAFVGSKPSAGVTIDAFSHYIMQSNRPEAYAMYTRTVTSDDAGHFRLDDLPATPVMISRRIPRSPGGWASGAPLAVTPKAGETTTIKLGGTGRPVTGRITLSPGLAVGPNDSISGTLVGRSPDDEPPLPPGFAQMTDVEKAKWLNAWRASAAGQAWMTAARAAQQTAVMPKFFPLVIATDGTFRADDVEPGLYKLNVDYYRSPTQSLPGRETRFAEVRADVIIPPPEHGPQSDEPIALPPMTATAVPGSNTARH